MNLGKKLIIYLTIGLSLLVGNIKRVEAQVPQIFGRVTDVLNGEGIENIEVVNEGIDSTYTNFNGEYWLDAVSVPPLQLNPFYGRQIRMLGADIFNIKGERVGELSQGQTLENFLTTNDIANGVYLLRTDPKMNNGIISTGRALRLESDIVWGGPQSLNSYYVNSSKNFTRSLDDNYYINLFFRDEDDTTKGDYFDIERDSLLVSGNLEQNEEMVPTWVTKESNPLDTIFVDYDYMTEVFPAWVGSVNATTWKTLGYNSIGVYIPPTPPGSTHDYQQLNVYSLFGQTSQGDPYDGWNTCVNDLNRANNYPVFFIAPDCTYVVDNGGAFVQYFPFLPVNARVVPIIGLPSPLYRVDFNLGYFNSKSDSVFLKISAHEFGHVQGFTDLYDDQYSDKIMYINIGTSLYTGNGTIDDDSKSVATIIHNRTDSAYYAIKNK